MYAFLCNYFPFQSLSPTKYKFVFVFNHLRKLLLKYLLDLSQYVNSARCWLLEKPNSTEWKFVFHSETKSGKIISILSLENAKTHYKHMDFSLYWICFTWHSLHLFSWLACTHFSKTKLIIQINKCKIGGVWTSFVIAKHIFRKTCKI